jgi:hypothetical protein
MVVRIPRSRHINEGIDVVAVMGGSHALLPQPSVAAPLTHLFGVPAFVSSHVLAIADEAIK